MLSAGLQISFNNKSFQLGADLSSAKFFRGPICQGPIWQRAVSSSSRGLYVCSAWCDFDLTFDLAVVTLTYKILSRQYLWNRKL